MGKNRSKSFPKSLYSGAAGETFVDTQTVSDESFSILVDNNDVAHVWYGQQVLLMMMLQKEELFPIRYWNPLLE